ncbi:MAG: hypothetical protein J7578_20370, partial [Chitinophagaceae bacterium]|nr:hypothetical protein [Chitinophagaceae bacterium]
MHVCEFIVDELTECVRAVKGGTVIQTEVLPMTLDVVKKIHMKDGWCFNWETEFRRECCQLF